MRTVLLGEEMAHRCAPFDLFSDPFNRHVEGDAAAGLVVEDFNGIFHMFLRVVSESLRTTSAAEASNDSYSTACLILCK